MNRIGAFKGRLGENIISQFKSLLSQNFIALFIFFVFVFYLLLLKLSPITWISEKDVKKPYNKNLLERETKPNTITLRLWWIVISEYTLKLAFPYKTLFPRHRNVLYPNLIQPLFFFLCNRTRHSFVQKMTIHFSIGVIIKIEIYWFTCICCVLYSIVLYYLVFHRIAKCRPVNECNKYLRFNVMQLELASVHTIDSCMILSQPILLIWNVKHYRFWTNWTFKKKYHMEYVEKY